MVREISQQAFDHASAIFEEIDQAKTCLKNCTDLAHKRMWKRNIQLLIDKRRKVLGMSLPPTCDDNEDMYPGEDIDGSL